MTDREKLTDEEREAITNCTDEGAWHAGCEALRIIDAQAAERAIQQDMLRTTLDDLNRKIDLLRVAEADRAALVKELEEARRKVLLQADAPALVAEVARLTKELDEARAKLNEFEHAYGYERTAEDVLQDVIAEVARLTEALAAAERDKAALLESNLGLSGMVEAAEAAGQGIPDGWVDETALLKEALAAADPAREQTWAERFRVLTERAEAAEQKLAAAELTEEYLRKDCDTQIANARADRLAAEQKLAAAERTAEMHSRGHDLMCQEKLAAEARVRELESHCQFQKDKLRTAESELAQLRARVAKAVTALTEYGPKTAGIARALEALRGPK